MSRDHLLRAIFAAPEEDTPRLMYADWLEEQDGVSDQDRATAEFVRTSCDMCVKPRNTMPRPAYQWLRENWRRLIPRTLALHEPHDSDLLPAAIGGPTLMLIPTGFVTGRQVQIRIGLKNPDNDWGRVYTCSLHLEFFKGFANKMTIWSPFATGLLWPVLSEEQPILRFMHESAVRAALPVDKTLDHVLESDLH